MQRPGANEGGREEEEKRSGISASLTGRLHNREMVWEGSFDTHADAAVTGAARRSSGAVRRDAYRTAKGVKAAGVFMASVSGGKAGWYSQKRLISHNSTRWYPNARRVGESPLSYPGLVVVAEMYKICLVQSPNIALYFHNAQGMAASCL